MIDEIKQFILNENILYPKYNRNIARPIYWQNKNKEWASFIFETFNGYKKNYDISFANFLRLYFFDEEIEYYEDVKDFLKNTKKLQINPGTKNFNKFYNEAKKFVSFEPKNFTEIIYCFRNNLRYRPRCEECDKETEFVVYNSGYRKFCSQTCQLKHNNKEKEIKQSDLSNEEIRELINRIPLDLRNLTNQTISDNFVNIINFSKHIDNLSTSERIHIFLEKLTFDDITCGCGDRKIFGSQGTGYNKTCGKRVCINIKRLGDKYYDENALNYNTLKGGQSYNSGFLYVIKSIDFDCYKIGIAQDPISRLNTLRKNIPDFNFVMCVFVENNLIKYERKLHNMFKLKNIKLNETFGGYTEIFNLDDNDMLKIREFVKNEIE